MWLLFFSSSYCWSHISQPSLALPTLWLFCWFAVFLLHFGVNGILISTVCGFVVISPSSATTGGSPRASLLHCHGHSLKACFWHAHPLDWLLDLPTIWLSLGFCQLVALVMAHASSSLSLGFSCLQAHPILVPTFFNGLHNRKMNFAAPLEGIHSSDGPGCSQSLWLSPLDNVHGKSSVIMTCQGYCPASSYIQHQAPIWGCATIISVLVVPCGCYQPGSWSLTTGCVPHYC